MSLSTNSTPSPSTGGPKFFTLETADPVTSRCGTRVNCGGTVLQVTGLPVSLDSLFRDETFCSPQCVRAFCLESLEALDGLDTAEARSMVSDLHEIAMDFAMTLVSILGK